MNRHTSRHYPMRQRPGGGLPGMLRNRSFGVQVVALFIPLALMIGLFFLVFYHAETAEEKAAIKAQEQFFVGAGADAMRYKLEAVVRDLRFLSGNSALKRYLDGQNEADRADLAADFANFCVSMGIFDKVRWIDEAGKERVRINYHRGKAIVVPDDRLQDKSDRYYFEDILSIARGEIYISPMDLNIEYGAVEVPYKPVIRVGTPVYDSAGRKRGIVVLSYLARHILDDLRMATKRISDHIAVLNHDGYWLYSPDPADEWGFMLGKRQTAETKLPAAWRIIHRGHNGQFEAEDGLWTFSTVYPLRAGQRSSTGSGLPAASSRGPIGGNEYAWKVVSHLPKERTGAIGRGLRVRLALFAGVLGAGAFIVCWKMAQAWARQRAAEQEERQLGERMSLLLDNLGDGVFGMGRDGTCTFINRAACDVLGLSREEVVGRDTHGLFHRLHDGGKGHPQGECPIIRSAVEGVLWSGEDQFLRKDGSAFPVEVRATPIREGGSVIGAVVVFQDITARKQLEDRIRQVQKMKAIGTLASGVAHDYNNALTTITGLAELLLTSMQDGDPMAQDLHRILAACERATQTTQRLLSFSREQMTTAAPIDLNAVISSISLSLERLLMPDGVFRTQLSEGPLMVIAERSQLKQVLTNLVANARDAMPRGGTVTITTGIKVVERSVARIIGHSRPGSYACAAVSDNGIGMDERTKQRVFEPYFTTKDVGKGAGLGLSEVFGIVDQLDGFVDIDSAAGGGTTVTFYLPQSELTAEG